jgi:hypothetical protein
MLSRGLELELVMKTDRHWIGDVCLAVLLALPTAAFANASDSLSRGEETAAVAAADVASVDTGAQQQVLRS